MDIKEAVEAAITMEFMSMIVYQDLANRVVDEKTGEILNYLSKQEETHVARLVEIFSDYSEESLDAVEDVDVIRGHRKEARSMLEDALKKRGITPSSPVSEILEFAREAERHAYTHYSRLASSCEDTVLAKVFSDIAEEEKTHELNIVRLKDMLGGN